MGTSAHLAWLTLALMWRNCGKDPLFRCKYPPLATVDAIASYARFTGSSGPVTNYCVPVSEVSGWSARCYQLSVLRVRRSAFGTHAVSVAGPRVWNSLSNHLRDPAVDPDQFRWDL